MADPILNDLLPEVQAQPAIKGQPGVEDRPEIEHRDKIELTLEQRRAVVQDGDHCLLVAGAGSGKTTTVEARVKYLVEHKQVPPEKILVLSYTNAAVDELKHRIKYCHGIDGVRISNFHKLGIAIMKRKTGEALPRAENKGDTSRRNAMSKLLQKLVKENKGLMEELVEFFAYYLEMPDDLSEGETIEEYRERELTRQWETMAGTLGDFVRREEAERQKEKMTLEGEFVRSKKEVVIANFLYLNRVEYVYEDDYYECQGISRKAVERLYLPDFHIIEKNKGGFDDMWLEHYALTESGEHDKFSDAEIARYQTGINWKRKLHKKRHTKLLETWSGYDDGRDLEDDLREKLKDEKVKLCPRDLQEVYNKIVETDAAQYKYLNRLSLLLVKFIKHYKILGYHGQEGFDELEATADERTRRFLKLAREAYAGYEDELKETGQIDFEDMINKANACLEEWLKTEKSMGIEELTADPDEPAGQAGSGRGGPSYIIVDEFQDINLQRFKMIQLLSRLTGAWVMAVGDDWQAIYAFAGGRLSLFTGFLEKIGARTKEHLVLTYTHRNAQELIDIAGKFVLENRRQIDKQLVSTKRLPRPVRVEVFNDTTSAKFLGKDDAKARKAKALAMAKKIDQIIDRDALAGSKIGVLSRYNGLIDDLGKTGLFTLEKVKGEGAGEEKTFLVRKKDAEDDPDIRLEAMTVHRAKGLEWDNVMVLDLLDDVWGFPSQVEDDPLLAMIRKAGLKKEEDEDDVTAKDYIPFAEERRLFYVALTRTKNRCYLLTPKSQPSRFVLELAKGPDVPGARGLKAGQGGSLRCPYCGYLLRRRDNGIYGDLGPGDKNKVLECSNDDELCGYVTTPADHPCPIFLCPDCQKRKRLKKPGPKRGVLRVRQNEVDNMFFYGCTNYDKKKIEAGRPKESCSHTEDIGLEKEWPKNEWKRRDL